MIIQPLNHHGETPNEIAVFLTEAELESVVSDLSARGIAATLPELPEEYQRGYCQGLYDQYLDSQKGRLVARLGDGVQFDSVEMEYDMVSRFVSEGDPGAFNPDYSPVDLTLRAFDPEGANAMRDFTVSPNEEAAARLERAFGGARLVVSFSIKPPNLA